MRLLNSFWPQPATESPVDCVNTARPWGSVNIQKPKKTTTTASTPLFMGSVLSGLGKVAQVRPPWYQSCRWDCGRHASAALDPPRGVVPQDPTGLLVLGVGRGRAGRRRAVVAAGLGLRGRRAEHDGARGVGGAAQGAPLQRAGQL